MNNREIQKYTLEDVIEQRNKALEDVRKSGENIKRKMRLLFEPPKANSKLELFTGNIDRIIAIYDGVMLGTKIIRKIRGLRIRR